MEHPLEDRFRISNCWLPEKYRKPKDRKFQAERTHQGPTPREQTHISTPLQSEHGGAREGPVLPRKKEKQRNTQVASKKFRNPHAPGFWEARFHARRQRTSDHHKTSAEERRRPPAAVPRTLSPAHESSRHRWALQAPVSTCLPKMSSGKRWDEHHQNRGGGGERVGKGMVLRVIFLPWVQR